MTPWAEGVRVRSLWRGLATGVDRFLLPRACLGCRRWTSGGPRLLCPGCASALLPLPAPRCPRCSSPRPACSLPPEESRIPRREGPTAALAECGECQDWPTVLQEAVQATALEGTARTLVHALKYEGWVDAARPMAERMASLVPPGDPGRRGVLVPVPSTPARIRRRGYNQAHLLARELSRITGIPLVADLLGRPGGESQVALHPDQRRANVRGAFQASETTAASLPPGPVTVVDDVLTTGATAGEVAMVLGAAGVPSVRFVSFARTLPDRLLDPPGAAPAGWHRIPGRLGAALRQLERGTPWVPRT